MGFRNTVTNLPIIVLPMVNAVLLRRYIKEVNWLIFLPHLLLTINGLASAYYHSTLNLFGQLVDELSILWLINICLVAYLPTMKWYPIRFRQHINQIRWIVVGLTIFISAFCFLKPNMNAFALMTFSIPGVAVIYHEGIKSVFVTELCFSVWRFHNKPLLFSVLASRKLKSSRGACSAFGVLRSLFGSVIVYSAMSGCTWARHICTQYFIC
jgi:hypothetical protein